MAKLQKALEAASEMLANKGITVTDIELRMLIEAAVGEFNDAFNRDVEYEFVIEDEAEDEEDEVSDSDDA